MSEENNYSKEMVRNLEMQIRDMIDERMSWTVNPADAEFSIQNLELQIRALIDEKRDLEQDINIYQKDLKELKNKAKALGAAVFEASLFGDELIKKAA